MTKPPEKVTVHVDGEIAAPVGDVWGLVSDFVGLVAAQGLEVEGHGEGIGMTRTVKIGSINVVERLEALDEATYCTSYSMVSGPVPLTAYMATVKLTPVDGRTRIEWSGSFEAPYGTEEQNAQMVEDLYRGGIKVLQKRFSSGEAE